MEEEGINFCPWQEMVFEWFLLPPIHRRIIWIWSPESVTGKSTFMNECKKKKELRGKCLTVTDLTLRDIACALNPTVKIVHINLPRDISDAQMHLLQGTLESLSDVGFV